MGDQNKYSREDDANFDRLMDFPDSRLGGSDETNPQIKDAGLTYSDSDNQAFEKLMSEPALVKKSSAESDRNSFLTDGYNDTDSSQFDELASIIGDLNIPSADGFTQANQSSIEYSAADKQAFKHLMQNGLGVVDDELEQTTPVAENSHIKIIDFDKEKSREKGRSRKGQNRIKIRYYD